MRQFILVALVTALLAGESYCLITARSEYEHTKAQEISRELSATVLELSANLRNGETDQFVRSREKYNAELEEFAKYADGSNVYESLKNYQTWLESSETERLLGLNATIAEYNAQSKEAKDIAAQVELLGGLNLDYSKTIADDVAKLTELAEKIRDCASYCFADDYAVLGQEFTDLQDKISADWQKINAENEARLQSAQLIESLESF